MWRPETLILYLSECFPPELIYGKKTWKPFTGPHLVVEGGEQEEGGEACAGQGVDRLEEQDDLQVGGDLLEGGA